MAEAETKDSHCNTSEKTKFYPYSAEMVCKVTEKVGSILEEAFACGGIDGVASSRKGSFRFNSGIGGPNPYGARERIIAEWTDKVIETSSNTTESHLKQSCTAKNGLGTRWSYPPSSKI